MSKFDKQKVLERILEEVPVLNNIKKTIKVDGKERAIYAYYLQCGVEDNELKYDREKASVKTTSESTICEIYSGGGHKHETLVKRFEAEMAEDENVREQAKAIKAPYEKSIVKGPAYSGPWISEDKSGDPGKSARNGEEYSYHDVATCFYQHINKICDSLGCDMQLNSNHIWVSKEAVLTMDDKNKKIKISLSEPIGIDFTKTDPPLQEALDSIEKAYEKAMTLKEHESYQIRVLPNKEG